jgi:hypothetical protein
VSRRVVSLLFLLSTGAAGVLLLAVSASAASSAQESSLTIRLLSIELSTGFVVDRAPKRVPSKGDVYSTKDALRNQVAQLGRAKGAIVGHDSVRGTLLSPHVASVTVRTVLPGGTVRARGTVTASQKRLQIRVVGGTGRFAGARGLVVERVLSSVRAIDTYRLQLP